MPEYIVEMRGDVRELYAVTAGSEEDAARDWMDGKLINSEAGSMEVYDVQEEKE